MLNDVYGREVGFVTHMSFSTTWIHTFSPTMFNELLVSAKRQNWYGGNNDPEKTNFMDMLGVPNPFGVTTEAIPQFTSTGWANQRHTISARIRGRRASSTTLSSTTTRRSFRQARVPVRRAFRYDQLNILPDQTWVAGTMDFDTAATDALRSAVPRRPIPQGTPLTGQNMGNMFIGARQLPEST